jgi:hypothetical protein
MAFSAKFPIHRFFCQREAGSGEMFFRNVMTGGALQGFVGRYLLDAGYFPVTSGAFFGCMRQKRIMRFMAGHAGLAGIVKFGNDLGKSGRP